MIALIEKYWPLGFLVTLVVVTADYYLYKTIDYYGFIIHNAAALLFGLILFFFGLWLRTEAVPWFIIWGGILVGAAMAINHAGKLLLFI